MDNCAFCGRPVKPTIHCKDSDRPYKVDYYILLTGKLSKTVIKTQNEEAETFEFHKLSEPRFVVSCADCIKKQEVNVELEKMFRGVPERTEQNNDVA